MQGVTVVDHPLVQHKLTLMREKERSTKGFRQLLNEIGMLLCYEVTRDLPVERIEIETPMTTMEGVQIAGKKLVFAPILRAGVGFLDGMLTLVPAARVAHIGPTVILNRCRRWSTTSRLHPTSRTAWCSCSIPCSPRRTRPWPPSTD
jgi:uracil phosphoribosyltransferase